MADLINKHDVSAEEAAKLRRKLYTSGTEEVITVPTKGGTIRVSASVSVSERKILGITVYK